MPACSQEDDLIKKYGIEGILDALTDRSDMHGRLAVLVESTAYDLPKVKVDGATCFTAYPTRSCIVVAPGDSKNFLTAFHIMKKDAQGKVKWVAESKNTVAMTRDELLNTYQCKLVRRKVGIFCACATWCRK